MKSSTVWHGHSTRPSLPAGTVRKASASLLRGRRNRLILQTTKNRKFPPLGNSLPYLSYVDFCGVRPAGRTLFLLYITSKRSHTKPHFVLQFLFFQLFSCILHGISKVLTFIYYISR